MSMSVDGLVSGMDTTALITQLLQAEAAPQTQLKAKLASTQNQASAYRTVNSTFAALRAAAEGLTTGSLSGGRKATSDNTAVTTTAGSSAIPGTAVTFSVTALAKTHAVLSQTQWSSLTTDIRTDSGGAPLQPGWPIQILEADGVTVRGTVSVPAGDPTFTLPDAAKAINDAKLGVRASVVTLGPNRHRLQLTSETSGAGGIFIVKGNGETVEAGNIGSGFTATRTGQDAVIDLGGVLATSSSNTFTDLMPGLSVTVSKEDPQQVTVAVATDHEATATKMQALVDAVNNALTTVKTYSSNAQGSTAALKGDSSLTSLAGRLLTAVSSAVDDRSPATVGLQLTRDGKITFDKAKFTTALKDDPDLAQRMVGGRAASLGANGAVGGGDDVTAVTGIAQRLVDVAKDASDSTTGSLVALAKGKDTAANDIKDRIEAWDLRLARRKEILARQFTAMESALGSMRNQSNWLAGQLNSLPS